MIFSVGSVLGANVAGHGALVGRGDVSVCVSGQVLVLYVDGCPHELAYAVWAFRRDHSIPRSPLHSTFDAIEFPFAIGWRWFQLALAHDLAVESQLVDHDRLVRREGKLLDPDSQQSVKKTLKPGYIFRYTHENVEPLP